MSLWLPSEGIIALTVKKEMFINKSPITRNHKFTELTTHGESEFTYTYTIYIDCKVTTCLLPT